jgi:hypothetical protein
MSAFRLASTALAALAVLAFACNGDNESGPVTPTSTATQTQGQTATPVDAGGATPTDGDEKPTPADNGDSETPGGEPTTATERATPAAEGTPAIAPEDQTAYLLQFADKTIENVDCQYNPATFVTTCPRFGTYSVDPPLTGQDITCRLGLIDGVPEYVACTQQQPLTAIFYEIQE